MTSSAGPHDLPDANDKVDTWLANQHQAMETDLAATLRLDAGLRDVRVANSLLRDDFDRRLVASAVWEDYSSGTLQAYLARARELANTYDAGADHEHGVQNIAEQLLRHDFEHNRASSADWKGLADESQERYRLRAQQLARHLDYPTDRPAAPAADSASEPQD